MRFPEEVPVLSDGVVTLRAHRPEDVDAVYEQCNDELSQRYTPVPVPYTREDAAAFVAGRADAWGSDTGWTFAIEAEVGAGPSRFAGSVGIRLEAMGIGEIGYSTHPQARGHGVTKAAVRLLADWAFDSQALTTILWRTVVGNFASWRVAWHNGFRFEGPTRRTLPQRGEALDAWRATLLATDDRGPKNTWLSRPRLAAGNVVLRPTEPKDEGRYL